MGGREVGRGCRLTHWRLKSKGQKYKRIGRADDVRRLVVGDARQAEATRLGVPVQQVILTPSEVLRYVEVHCSWWYNLFTESGVEYEPVKKKVHSADADGWI